MGPSEKFPNGKFKYGLSYKTDASFDSSAFDYVSIWIGTNDYAGNTDFNIWYQGEMIKHCKLKNKLPVFYSYIIAFEARTKQGLQDCDVDPNYNLCTGVRKRNKLFLISNADN